MILEDGRAIAERSDSKPMLKKIQNMFSWHECLSYTEISKVLGSVWIYRPGHAEVMGNVRANRLALELTLMAH